MLFFVTWNKNKNIKSNNNYAIKIKSYIQIQVEAVDKKYIDKKFRVKKIRINFAVIKNILTSH